jgi:hypothetical protein
LNPEQRPWLANPWLSGVFALAIGGIGLLLKGRDAWSQKGPSSLVLLIIPVFGIALLFFSALLKLRARKYSGTYFEMESVPFFLGQKLRGTVHTPLGDFKGPVRFRLNCIRRRKSPTHTHGVGVGGAKDTWDELVWCGQHSISFPGASADSKWTTMPAEIAIPADAPRQRTRLIPMTTEKNQSPRSVYNKFENQLALVTLRLEETVPGILLRTQSGCGTSSFG